MRRIKDGEMSADNFVFEARSFPVIFPAEEDPDTWAKSVTEDKQYTTVKISCLCMYTFIPFILSLIFMLQRYGLA